MLIVKLEKRPIKTSKFQPFTIGEFPITIAKRLCLNYETKKMK